MNQVLMSNHCHKDVDYKVVPMQAGQSPTNSSDSTLLQQLDVKNTVYNCIMRKREFTILGSDVYESEFYVCLQSPYPFFAFYARLLSFVLSSLCLTRRNQARTIVASQQARPAIARRQAIGDRGEAVG